jgi:hypothetical protein
MREMKEKKEIEKQILEMLEGAFFSDDNELIFQVAEELNAYVRQLEVEGKSESISNKQGQLLDLQDKIIRGISFALESFQEGGSPFRDVTHEYPSFEGFVGESILGTIDGSPGYTMQSEGGETIFVQDLSAGKQIWTYFKDGQVSKYKFLEVDTEIDTPMKKLAYVGKGIEELKMIQSELDEIKENQIDE